MCTLSPIENILNVWLLVLRVVLIATFLKHVRLCKIKQLETVISVLYGQTAGAISC